MVQNTKIPFLIWENFQPDPETTFILNTTEATSETTRNPTTTTTIAVITPTTATTTTESSMKETVLVLSTHKSNVPIVIGLNGKPVKMMTLKSYFIILRSGS